MSYFDRTSNIKAPPDMVWEAAYKFAQKGKIEIDQPHRLLIATSLGLGYVYLLKAQPDGSTYLRHVVASAAHVQDAFNSMQDPWAILDALSTRAASAAGEVAGTVLGLVGANPRAMGQSAGENAIKRIQKEAELAASRAHWTPRPVEAEPVTPVMPTVTVAPEYPAASITPPPAPPGKSPWNPNTYIGLVIFASFGAAGILAGLNWRRLGKPHWAVPTLVVSLIGLVGLVMVLMILPGTEAVSRVIGYGINVGIGALLAYWQLPAYRQWMAAYGQTAKKESGCLIQLAAVVVALAVIGLTIFGVVMFQSSRSDPAIEHYNLGVEYQEKGQQDRAIQEYTRAIEINAKLPEAYLNRGYAYFQQDEFERAIQDYDRAIALKPDLVLAYVNRSVAYGIKGDYARALADLDKAISLDPKYAGAYFWRGLIYAESNEPQKAINDLEKALSLGLKPEVKQNAEEVLQQLKSSP